MDINNKMDLNLINSNNITLAEIQRIQELSEYVLPERVYLQYIRCTKGNENLSYDQAKKKIIRNLVLGRKVASFKDCQYKQVFFYNDLMIHINKVEKSICYIKNLASVNKAKKEDLNVIMGIEQ